MNERPRQRQRAVCHHPVVLGTLLALGITTATSAQRQPTLEALELLPSAHGVELTLRSTAKLALIGVQIDPDGSIVLQLPRHKPAPGVQDLFREVGLVSAVRVVPQETSRGPMTRLVISTRAPAAHSVSTDRRRLRLLLWPEDAPPPGDAEARVLRQQVDELRSSLTTSERVRDQLTGRVETLTRDNQMLVVRFETLESRRRDLDGELKGTLDQVTGMLRNLSAESEALRSQLRDAETREATLHQQIEGLESALATADGDRVGLNTRLDAALHERDALSEQIHTLEARGLELESDLATRTTEIERLEREGTDTAMALGDQLEAAADREERLRAQLDTLTSLVRATEDRPEVRYDYDPEGLRSTAEHEESLRAAAAAETRMTSEVQALEAALAAARSEVDELRAATTADDQDAARQLADLEAERAGLIDALEASRAELGRMQQHGGMLLGWTQVGVNLRQGPGTNYQRFRVLPVGTPVEVIGREKDWVHVRVGSQDGWLAAAYVQVDEPSPGSTTVAGTMSPPESQAPGKDNTVDDNGEGDEVVVALRSSTSKPSGKPMGRILDTDGAELHAGPGDEFASIAVVPPASDVEVLGGDSKWLEIRFGDTRGWVHRSTIVIPDR